MKQPRTLYFGLTLFLLAALVLSVRPSAQTENQTRAAMNAMNVQLQQSGKNVRVAVVDYLTTSDAVGQTVYADNRTKQLGSDWVPGDPNRGGFYDISWLSDQVEGNPSAISLSDTQDAIDRAMATWDGVQCSVIPLTKLGDSGFDWGYVQYLLGFGGVPGWYADFTQAGWLPREFFDAIAPPDGGDYILGATFTFIWIDDSTGEPTDIDNNGKTDVAFREVYYNDAFSWGINQTYDIETVVLHEAGHGLSQGHFGKIFRTTQNGQLHFAPRAVMNAAYSGIQQELTGTDTGGHCSIWASWPNK